MKIAIDLDGTAWKHRKEFSSLVSVLKLGGATVGILTAHCNIKDEDMRLWESRGFPKIDFYLSKTSQEINTPAREWKLSMCNAHKIDFLYDDFDSETIRLEVI